MSNKLETKFVCPKCGHKSSIYDSPLVDGFPALCNVCLHRALVKLGVPEVVKC